MKKILVPIDFTNTSEHALDWAKFLAKHYSKDGKSTVLTLMHVTQPYIPDTTLPTGGIGGGMLVAQELEDIGENSLRQRVEALKAEGFVTQSEARVGSVDDEIISVADEQKPDLIVMGRGHFDSFFDRLAGSSATDVALTASCPVLVVPAPEDSAYGTAIRLNHIAYATQLEFNENHILRQAVDVSRSFGSKLTLLKINADNQPDVHDDKEYLHQIKSEFGAERFAEANVHADNVTEGLSRFIKESTPDILVMTTRDRDFLSRLLSPSLTKHMLLNSKIPILVYHAKENY